MPRHATRTDRREFAIRLVALALLWAAGLVVGFFALLSIGTRYSCAHSAHGLACRTPGTVLGVVLVLAVISVVTAATVMSLDARRRSRLALVIGLGVVALAGCYLGARALINTA